MRVNWTTKAMIFYSVIPTLPLCVTHPIDRGGLERN